MPKVSVIIIAYNMAREVPRTVQSFLPPYQEKLEAGDVEILVMENGSSSPIPETVRSGWPPAVRYINVPSPSASPAAALNLGVDMASAPVVVPVIDGARMASPGLLHNGLSVLRQEPDAFVGTTGFHLGSQRQPIAVLSGYNQQVEDELLASIGWPKQGYRLFEICSPGGSAGGAWFGGASESNAPLLLKARYLELGGFDPAFDIPGGGLVNLDFYERAVTSGKPYYMLVGEGTFHQIHGGVTTSKSVREVEADGRTTFQRYTDQYEAIRSRPWKIPQRLPILYGIHRPQCSKISLAALKSISGLA
ncbi:MAG: glycosyltransferase [Alphaproteobacteria bacterium]|nr:glycosyltransferase [Alphaproteobacteria bacterium]